MVPVERSVIVTHPDGSEECFSSLKNAAKYMILLGVSDKPIAQVINRIFSNASGKTKKVFKKEYKFRYND